MLRVNFLPRINRAFLVANFLSMVTDLSTLRVNFSSWVADLSTLRANFLHVWWYQVVSVLP